MTIELIEESRTALSEYGRISIAFMVGSNLRRDSPRRSVRVVHADRTAPRRAPRKGLRRDRRRRTAEVPASGRSGGRVRYAWSDDVGGAARSGSAVGHSRVPQARGRGIGTALFNSVESSARLHACRQLKVETQNTNVGACCFYERQRCQLRAANRGVYPDHPDDIQRLWFKELTNDCLLNWPGKTSAAATLGAES
jgi:GNAT superfamily N-acetyltransferase